MFLYHVYRLIVFGYAKTKIVLRYGNKNYFSIFKADYFLYVGTFMTDMTFVQF